MEGRIDLVAMCTERRLQCVMAATPAYIEVHSQMTNTALLPAAVTGAERGFQEENEGTRVGTCEKESQGAEHEGSRTGDRTEANRGKIRCSAPAM